MPILLKYRALQYQIDFNCVNPNDSGGVNRHRIGAVVFNANGPKEKKQSFLKVRCTCFDCETGDNAQKERSKFRIG